MWPACGRYRIAELQQLGVADPFRTGDYRRARSAATRRTWCSSRPARGLATLPIALDLAVPVRQAWDVLLDPESIAPGATVTIVGGGIVGIETADLLVTRGCRVTVLEIQATVAPEMARNNRFEVLARLERGRRQRS